MVTEKTKTTVVDAVQVLAKQKKKADPSLTDEQARALIWKQFPQLAAAWRLANEPKV